MRNKLLLLAFIFFVLPAVSAVDSNLEIHTLPIYDVSVFILDPGDKYYSLQSIKPSRTGFDGIARVNFSTNFSEVGIKLIIKKNGEVVFSERLPNQNTGGLIKLYVLINETDEFKTPPPVQAAELTTENESINGIKNNKSANESSVDETKTTKTAKTTGFAVSNVKELLSKTNIYFILIVAFVLVFIIVLLAFRKKVKWLHKEYYSNDKPPTILYDKQLEALERRVKQTQNEINELKNRSRMKFEAQRKFEEAKKELEKFGG